MKKFSTNSKRILLIAGILTISSLFSFYLNFRLPTSSISNVSNLSAGKGISASTSFAYSSRITDGDKTTSNYSSSGSGVQWVQLDLQVPYDLNNIKLWHYFGDGRKYHDVIVQLSNDPDFSSGVTTVYNNDIDNSAGLGAGTDSEYAETSSGKNITFHTVSARYARFYSNGSTANSSNHYVEIEIYGVIHPTSITMNPSTASINIEGITILTATVLPANASNKSVDWSSTNTGVATVSSSGVVTGVSAGTATITAATADGGKTAACTVTVSSTPVSSGINVKDYGAKGDGVSDDSYAIQNAVNYAYSKGGGTVYIPDGTYIVYPEHSIKLKSNVTLSLSSNAELKANPTSLPEFSVVYMYNITNSGIIGGKIIGERNEHLGTTGEHGQGIYIQGSSGIHIADVSVSNCWGDGIYLGSTPEQNYCGNILIENVYLDNNRRQGITVISAKNLTIKNSIITNTNGTNPYSGINFEPNFNTEFMTNVVVQNVQTMNNEGYGIYINGIDRLSTGPNANDVSVTIINHTDIGSLQGAISNMTAYTRNHVFFK